MHRPSLYRMKYVLSLIHIYAMVSEKHSGFVINAGAATASQVRQLMQDVDAIVYEKFQVHLEPEVRLIGEF